MQLNPFSVSYAGFWGQTRLSGPDFVAKAAGTGFTTVMLAAKRPHVSPLDATDARLGSIKDVIEENHAK